MAKANPPERRYTHGGRVAHLLTYGIDYGSFPYASALCGYSPAWGSAWLGSGSQPEEELACRLVTCKRCLLAREAANGRCRACGAPLPEPVRAVVNIETAVPVKFFVQACPSCRMEQYSSGVVGE